MAHQENRSEDESNADASTERLMAEAEAPVVDDMVEQAERKLAAEADGTGKDTDRRDLGGGFAELKRSAESGADEVEPYIQQLRNDHGQARVETDQQMNAKPMFQQHDKNPAFDARKPTDEELERAAGMDTRDFSARADTTTDQEKRDLRQQMDAGSTDNWKAGKDPSFYYHRKPTDEELERAAGMDTRDFSARTESMPDPTTVEAGIDQVEAHLRQAAETEFPDVSDAETADPVKYAGKEYEAKHLIELKDKHVAGLAGALDNATPPPTGDTTEHMIHIASGELINLTREMHKRGLVPDPRDEQGNVHLPAQDIKEAAALLHGPLQEQDDDNLTQAAETASRFKMLADAPGLSPDQRRFATEKALILEDITTQLIAMAERAQSGEPEPETDPFKLAAAEIQPQYLTHTTPDTEALDYLKGMWLSRAKADRLNELGNTFRLLPEIKEDTAPDDPDLLSHDADIDRLTAEIIAMTHKQDIENNMASENQPVRAHRADIDRLYARVADDPAALDSLAVVYSRLRKDADSDAGGKRSAEEVEFNQSKMSILAAVLARREAEGGAQPA